MGPSSGNKCGCGLACREHQVLSRELAQKTAHHVTRTLEDPDFVSEELLSLDVHCEANPGEETLLSEVSFFTYQTGRIK